MSVYGKLCTNEPHLSIAIVHDLHIRVIQRSPSLIEWFKLSLVENYFRLHNYELRSLSASWALRNSFLALQSRLGVSLKISLKYRLIFMNDTYLIYEWDRIELNVDAYGERI